MGIKMVFQAVAQLVVMRPDGAIVSEVYTRQQIKPAVLAYFNDGAEGVLVVFEGKQYHCSPNATGYARQEVQNHPWASLLS